MPARLCRIPRTEPKPQPRILALAFTWPYSEGNGWRIENRGECAQLIPRVQASRYHVYEAPLTGFDPYNAVVCGFGIYFLARLDPAPTERPYWPPRPELAEIIRWNLERP